LKIKDDLIGVVYVDNRIHTGMFQQSDFELISAFANQAAVAIDNARLFDDLQESNKELQIAYQATLEGWVRALDLRDKETEGHTKRVTALTQKLAKSMGVSDDDLVHITRGALLHDIGKMAIPDGILLKPGGLTEDERRLVQKHPVYAYEMLSPIKFLLPALDIPYCHHEKWDGSGYPRGLQGNDIPFAARIFTVVDVWDALVSDRPYRKGLEPADIRERIRKDAGVHFDPLVVDAFLKLDTISA
jgi:putative nucleotidyltransferase with HDIG domain